jgi:hypothetical protein
MSGRNLVDEMRSGARPITDTPKRGGVFDIVAALAAVVAISALGYVGYGAWSSGKPPGPPPVQVATVTPVSTTPVAWTEADEKACNTRASAAASNPDTGTYLITNQSIAEGAAGLGTKIECLLTAKPKRFCGPEGNAQLVAIVNDYMNRMGMVRIGLAAQGAPMAFAGGMLGGEAAMGDGVYDMMKTDTLKYLKGFDARIVKAIRILGANGLVKAEDFKPFPFAGVPKSIEEMFAGVSVKQELCG